MANLIFEKRYKATPSRKISLFNIYPRAAGEVSYYKERGLCAQNYEHLSAIAREEITKAGKENRNYFEIYFDFEYDDDLASSAISDVISEYNSLYPGTFEEVCRIFRASDTLYAATVQLFYN